MSLIRFPLLILVIAAALLLPTGDNPPPDPASAETQADLLAAFYSRLHSDPGVNLLSFDLFNPELDTAFTSPDGTKAVLWLALRDDSGRLLATEPGFAVAHRSDDGWYVLLPGDPGWEETLNNLPAGMLPLELKMPPANITLDAITSSGPLNLMRSGSIFFGRA